MPRDESTPTMPTSLGQLTMPLPVRCTTTIEPTPHGLWHVTTTYGWDAAAHRSAGSANESS